MNELHGNIDILASGEVGYVAICHSCGNLQVAVGTVIFEMNPDSFLLLSDRLNRMHRELDLRIQKFPDGERVLLSTPAESMYLYLSKSQFEELLCVFNEASIEFLLKRELYEILG